MTKAQMIDQQAFERLCNEIDNKMADEAMEDLAEELRRQERLNELRVPFNPHLDI